MLFTTTPIVLFMAAAAQAAAIARPGEQATKAQSLDKRGSTMTGQWDSVATGTYTLYNDFWNIGQASSGSQSTTFTSLVGDVIAWSTSWSWAGGAGQVKTYANVVVKQSTGIKLSTISSIPTTWSWSYTGSNIIADVAYDLFTSSTASGSNQYEIMIWLGALGGAGPISSTGSAIATPTIGGSSWKLFYGLNGNTKVFSFVAPSQITNFKSDLALFLKYLEGQQGFSSSQFVTSIGAGTEPFSGNNAVLSVKAYSVAVKVGSTTPVVAVVATKITTVSKATSTPVTKATVTAHSTTSKAAVQTSTRSKCKSVTPTTTAPKATGTPQPRWGQCGGTGYTGSKVCVAGSTCQVQNAYYSQCL